MGDADLSTPARPSGQTASRGADPQEQWPVAPPRAHRRAHGCKSRQLSQRERTVRHLFTSQIPGRTTRPRRQAGLRFIGLGVLATVAMTACGGSAESSSAESSDAPVKIGVLAALSGVYSSVGTPIKQGFDLYLEEHDNELGGRKIETVYADEGAGPQTGVPAAQKLMQQDKVVAITGVVSSATALALKAPMEQSKVLLVSANAGPAAMGNSDYMWRASSDTYQASFAAGEHMAEALAGKKVFFMAADYAAGRDMFDAFKSGFEGAGGELAGEQFTPLGEVQDFQPYFGAIQSSGAEATYVFYAGGDALRFVGQYTQFGIDDQAPLYAFGAAVEGDALAALGEAALDVKSSYYYSDQLDNPVNKAFVKAYTAKYEKAPDTYAMFGYDAAQVLDKALAEVDGEVTGETLAKAVANVGTIESPRGDWSFTENHAPEQHVYLRNVVEQDGAFVNEVVEDLGVFGDIDLK